MLIESPTWETPPIYHLLWTANLLRSVKFIVVPYQHAWERLYLTMCTTSAAAQFVLTVLVCQHWKLEKISFFWCWVAVGTVKEKVEPLTSNKKVNFTATSIKLCGRLGPSGGMLSWDNQASSGWGKRGRSLVWDSQNMHYPCINTVCPTSPNPY